MDITSLQSYEKLLVIRAQKLNELNNLKKQVKELKLLIQNLNSILSKHNIERFVSKKDASAAVASRASKASHKTQKAKPKSLSELDRLGRNLSDIEKKLQQLA